MIIEAFLDYNEIIKVIFEIQEDKIDYHFKCENGENKLTNNIIANLQQATVLEKTEDPNIYRLAINNTIFINIAKDTGNIEVINKLIVFETRLLAQGKKSDIILNREKNTDFRPKTDLHTHFAGAIRSDVLIAIGKEKNISYPSVFLSEIGIDIGKYVVDSNGNININTISDEDIEKLENNLKISSITQDTFNKMEDIYRLRGPFTKNKALFVDYLRALANDYKANGVEYAELSFSAFISDPEYMQMIEEYIPEIEEETGVKLRFLAGIWRHSDKEWNLDDTDRIKSIAKSRYIVGCDVMGHETNSTDAVKEELENLARYAIEEDPNFVIRVHAGENPIFQDNVKRTLEIIYDTYKKIGEGKPMPKVRIGHGLYGVDEEVLRLAKEMGAIIEFNMSSNLALNNIDDITEVPIAQYIKHGIKVVLATDGHGMYSTDSQQEVLLAIAAGVDIEDFEVIKDVENEVINAISERDKLHPPIGEIASMYNDNVKYSSENGKARWSKEVAEKYKKQKEEKKNHLDGKIALIDVITDSKTIEEDTKGKIPIVLTGASKGNWPNILPQDQEKISLIMQVLANVINPEMAFIVTGGTNHGVEKQMHEAVNRRNKAAADKLVLLGTFTMEAANDDTSNIERDTITHATILELNGRTAKNWQELPDTQLEYARQKNGCMIAVGGGNVVANMIQRAHNMGIDMHLMNGPYGASTNKSKSLEGNDYSFVGVEDLLRRLYEWNKEIFVKEFSLEKIPEYIKYANSMIENSLTTAHNPANFGLGAISEIDKSVTMEERISGMMTLQSQIRSENRKKTEDRA